jgi:type IV fimbrial biogenesis protein FimT
MRRLNPQRGFTLIELMIAITIMTLLVVTGLPYFGEYMANSRLREGGHAVMAEALFAQSEAIKRNSTVRMAVNGATLTTTDFVNGTALRTRTLTDGLSAGTGITNVDFSGRGTTVPFGTTINLDLSKSGASCTLYRCPRVVIDGGGGIRICADKNSCT